MVSMRRSKAVHGRKVSKSVKSVKSVRRASASRTSSYLKGMGYDGKDQFAQTPPSIYQPLHKEFKFTFDPAPVNPSFDGLTIPWKSRNFVNPPYNNVSKWVEKAIGEAAQGKTSVFLIPFRPHTKYWGHIMKAASEIRLFEKRIPFQGYDRPAPFAVVLVVLTPVVSHVYSNFKVVDLVKESGGRTIAHLLAFYRKKYAFDHVVTDFQGDAATDRWGAKSSFVCSTIQLAQLITRAEVEAKAGKTVVLVIPFRPESSYFIDRVIFGHARSIEAIQPSIICEGFTQPAPTGTGALIFGPGALQRTKGPRLSVVPPV